MLLEDRVRQRLIARGLLDVVKRVARHHHVLVSEVLSPVRHKTFVAARHEVWLRMRKHFGFSYPELGNLFECDHTTVMNGVREAKRRKTVDG